MNESHDPGLQRERTAMAWTRTGLAVLVNSLVVLRAGTNSSDVFLLTLGFLLLAAAGAAVACGAWRSRRLAQGDDPATPWAIVLATVGTTWLASLAAVGAVIVDR